MNPRTCAAAALLLFLASGGRAEARDAVAVLDLRFLERTDVVTALMCYGDDGDDCHPWATAHLFEARVRKTIHGELPKTFKVLYGRHALAESNVRGLVARLNRLEDSSEGAQYQVAGVAKEGDLACFPWWGPDGQGFEAVPRHGDLLQCFDPDDTEENWTADSPLADREKSLRAANDAYNAALIAGDVAALEKLFAKEFVYTSPRGVVKNRAEQLDEFRPGALDIVAGTGSEESFQVHGATGIVTGRFDARGTYAGQPFDAIERYTSVWIIRDGRWQLVAEQGTLRSPTNR
jgi:ketosteroid isomerase-like protein